MNKAIIDRNKTQGGTSSNVSSIVKDAKPERVNRYVMSSGAKRIWLENYMPDEADSINFPGALSRVGDDIATEERKKKARLLIFSLCVAVLLLIVSVFIGYFSSRLVIKEIRVEGSELYTADMLLSSSGLDFNDKLPIFSTDTIENALLAEYPYIKNCSISVKLPNTLIFTVIEDKAEIYAEIFGEYYAMNSSLRILERSENKEDFSDLLFVKLPHVKSAVVGEQLELADGLDGDYIVSFLASVNASELAHRLGIVHFDKKYDIVASVDDKFRILFGSPSEMSLKISAVAHIIDENTENCTSGSVIDVRVVDIAGIVMNADIDPDARE
ncbi:MAG: cell division protein FtsQ/DivIB [Eubacteriales bacterium]